MTSDSANVYRKLYSEYILYPAERILCFLSGRIKQKERKKRK